MYKNRLLVAILIISIIIAIPGCGRSAHAPENTMLNDIPAVDCYATLLDDSFIYFTFTSSNAISIYRHFFDGKTILIGTIEDYVFNLGLFTVTNNHVYFYVTTAISAESVFENNTYKNNIYSVELKSNSFELVYSESECLPGALLHSTDKYLVSRQSERDENNVLSTYIELYDLETAAVVNSSKVFCLDDSRNVGEYMINICTDNGFIYALVDTRYEDGSNEALLYKYDIDFNVVSAIDMKNISDYILKARVGNMNINNDIVYMKNYSGDAFIGRIIENSIVPLIKQQYLEVAVNYFDDVPLYYQRTGSTLYQFDFSTSELQKITLQTSNDFIIKNVLINGNNSLITMFTYETSYFDKKEDKVYYVNRDNIASLVYGND